MLSLNCAARLFQYCFSCVEFPPSRRLSRCILSHADFHSGTTTSLSLPHATSSPASCTTPSSPRWTSTTCPPPALRTPRGRARGCRFRPGTLWPGAGLRCSSFCGYAVFARVVGMCRARDACCATEPAAASLTTFAGAPLHVVCARRRICSCRPRPLQRACARFAAPRAAGGHAVAALARTCGAAGQAIPWQRAAAAFVLRQPPVHPADPPRRCCRPQRALQHRAQIRRLHRQALLQRRRAQGFGPIMMMMMTSAAVGAACERGESLS